MTMLRPIQTLAAACAALSLTAMTPAARAQVAATDPVRVEGGLISGAIRDGARVYLGVPYAAAPVGDLRWRPPQPVRPWSGIKAATAFSPVCRQTVSWIKEPQSEDCLYLNIWTPAAPAPHPLPVMVWIHGGGFFGGSGSQPLYFGGHLVSQGVILVTLNYRLGVLGFYASPQLSAEAADHASGNQGIRDQIAALAWVQRNIAALGGDPSRVTIFGESAGANSVGVLVDSPLAKGLFQRAIAESGDDAVPITPAEDHRFDRSAAEAAGAAFAQAAGASDLAALRAIDADTLIHKPWSPHTVIDGQVLTADQTTVYQAHRANPVPILVGWNADEGVDLGTDLLGSSQFDAAHRLALMQGVVFKPLTPALIATYPGATDAQAKASLVRFATDYWGWRMWRWAKLQTEAQAAPAYLYFFIHYPAEPNTPCGYGCHAGHGAEIPFVFNQLDQDPRQWSASDRQLADQMIRYWTNFAKTGDPNGQGLPAWPAFDGASGTIHRLGDAGEIAARGTVADLAAFEP